MRKFFFPYIAGLILSVVILACHSGGETAKANPGYNNNDDLRVNAHKMVYVDTTLPQYRNIIRRLDSFYHLQARMGFNGSVLIGEKGKVIYERYFGMANRETGRKLSVESSCQLASVSKTFTAAAVLYLHEHKYLNIDDKVSVYIPSFPYKDVTVKMLLNHRAGLPDYLKWVPRFSKDQRTPINNDRVLEMFARHRPPLEFKPDTRFKYSNSNYAVLASVIEAVTDTNYADFMKGYIFAPLGMNNTFVYNPKQRLPEAAAISYKATWVREPDMFADGVYGDKGIYSTPQDMYRWDQSFYKGTLLTNETIEMAYGPCSFEKPGIRNYGLGWRMLCFPDQRQIIYHNGWWHGNNTVFYRFIQENFTIITLGNKYNSGIYKQAPVAYSLVKNIPVNSTFEADE